MKTRNPIALFFAGIALALAPVQAASSASTPPSTGAVEGRVFNPATGEYIRNAEVRIQGTGVLETTAADGRYRISNVPTGSVAVTVSYTGYQVATANVTVTLLNGNA